MKLSVKNFSKSRPRHSIDDPYTGVARTRDGVLLGTAFDSLMPSGPGLEGRRHDEPGRTRRLKAPSGAHAVEFSKTVAPPWAGIPPWTHRETSAPWRARESSAPARPCKRVPARRPAGS